MAGLLVTYSAADGFIDSSRLICREDRLNAACVQLRMPSVASRIRVIPAQAADAAMA